MQIILIGYRGSGKTSVGRLLARDLKLDFVDGDDMVRERFAMDSIAEIWKRFGEPAFRKTEAEVTSELCGRDGIVVSLGGGAILHPQGRKAVADARGLCVYLKGSPAVLYQRIHGDPGTGEDRPNLTNLGGGIAEIESVLAQRREIYESLADLILDVDHLDIDQTAAAIRERIGKS
ncbi:MAG: shikimate kinase [Phycisphaeraceae bacterium]|nr:shikimate kinase [Phycisphaeraceae bacterium]